MKFIIQNNKFQNLKKRVVDTICIKEAPTVRSLLNDDRTYKVRRFLIKEQTQKKWHEFLFLKHLT